MNPDYQDRLKEILNKFGSACTGEEGLLYSFAEHVQACQAAINALNGETIGEHFPGCPAVTKYVGPEDTPFDGTFSDCWIDGLCRRFGVGS